MSFELKVLKASHGDSIIIRGEFNGQYRNILIDGGPSSTFISPLFPGELKHFLNEIKEANQRIDLLIITHEDQDHICGILRAFEENDYLSELTDEVWFNSGKLVSKFIDNIDCEDKVIIGNNNSKLTSINDGIKLEDHLREKNIKHDTLVYSRNTNNLILERFGCYFEIISPSINKLRKRNRKWAEKYPSVTTSGESDNRPLSTLMKRKEKVVDGSPSNGSSIAFVFKYENKSILLLGDAHASEVVRGLKAHGYSNNHKLKVDYVKISHHGSKNNTSRKLLNLIDCTNFIITTDGSYHGHPDKEVFARIIDSYGHKTKFLFNYPALIDRLFSSEDRTSYQFDAVEIKTVVI